ncbi:MAG: hypothetical protein E6K93_00745 [Thaumarchaeota archaeon]|nr:MAG: hypothetical protein E6K93_00745 [Nitrososphaerota archaeon]
MDIAMTKMNIPKEVMEFIKQDTYSLLIKGSAGTGKTTLALTILHELGINKNCLYISTRISPEQLFKYYPWLEEFFGQPKKSQLSEIEEVDTDTPIFVDARLDEPAALSERITNALMDVKSPTIIIDSWDSIGIFMDKEALMNNARVLQTWRERSSAKIIFIAEDTVSTTFDYLADGVVELRLTSYRERNVREVFLSKLRGVGINRPLYIFTLNNRKFHSFEPFHPTDLRIALDNPSKKGIKSRENIPSASSLVTGYKELDSLLGEGLPLRSIVNLEIDAHVNVKVALILLGRIISNFTSTGNPVLFQPLDEIESDYTTKYLECCIPSTKQKLIELLPAGLAKEKGTKSRYSGSHHETAKQLESIQKYVIKMRKKHGKKHLFTIMGLDLTQFSTNDEYRKAARHLIDLLKSVSVVSILVSRNADDGPRENRLAIGDVHLKILELKGNLFLKSEVPWSHLYAIVFEKHDGCPAINLQPVI